jgi:Holliday junction resolvase
VSLARHNPRRDKSEKEIKECLAAYGCIVTPISGPGVPDLLVICPPSWRHSIILVECKSHRGAKLTRQQQDWHHWAKCNKAPVFVCWDIESTLKAIEDARKAL